MLVLSFNQAGDSVSKKKRNSDGQDESLTTKIKCEMKDEGTRRSGSNAGKGKGGGKRGHNVADTLLLMMFLGWANERDTKHLFCVHAAQTGKHLLRTQNVSDKNQKLFCVSDTNFVSATNVARTGKR